METKNDIQKEIDDLQKQINDLTARRNVLTTEREKILAALDERKRQIGKLILDGQETLRETTAQASDKEKLQGLNEAIDQAESHLSELEDKHKNGLMALARVEYDRLAYDADELLKGFMDALSEAIKFVPVLDAKFAELFKIQADAGKDVAFDDHVRVVRDIYRYFDDETKMIIIKLQRSEDSYPTVLANVRKARG